MAKLLVLSGLPGSGKSYRRREWLAEDPDGRTYINYDEARLARYGVGWRFNRREEQQMKDACLEQVKASLKAGLSVCIDNTNLSSSVRLGWKQLAEQHGAIYIEEEIDTDLDECIRRDKLRGDKRVGRAVIERMAMQYGFLEFDKEVEYVIVDIDGTVADCAHRAHYVRPTCLKCGAPAEKSDRWHCSDAMCHSFDVSKKNWPAFFEAIDKDPPIARIIDLVWLLAKEYRILFITGRDTSLAIKTEDWLDTWFSEDQPFYDRLFMRQNGDSREDTIIKKEILDFLPKDRVAYVLDDRDRVVEMYRKEGLTVLQPCKGAY